jgi:hypothetical protein
MEQEKARSTAAALSRHCMHPPSWPGQLPIVLDVLCSRVLHTGGGRKSERLSGRSVDSRPTHTTKQHVRSPAPTPSGPSRGRPALLAQLLAPVLPFAPSPPSVAFGWKKKEAFRFSCPGLSTSSEAPSPAEDAARAPAGWRTRRKGGRARARPKLGVSRSRSCVCVASRWCGGWTDASRLSMLHSLLEGRAWFVLQAPFRHRGPGLVAGLPLPAQQGTGPSGCFFTGQGFHKRTGLV